MFWQKIFAAFKPDVTVKFVSRGGKPVLEAIARDIISKNIADTYVAIDSDYDEYFGDRIADRRVLYTYGYSLENDIFSFDNVHRTYAALAHVQNLSPRVRARLKSEFERVTSELRLGVYADILALKAKTSVLPRDAPGRVVGSDPATLRPFVRKSEVRKLCGAANERSRPRAGVTLTAKVDVAKLCVGHILKVAVSHILRATLREFHNRANFSADHIRDMALQTFSVTLQGRNALVTHYRRQMAAL
jgi:hypothetical protein